MGVDEKHVEAPLLHEIGEAVAEHRHVVALTENPSDIARVDAGWDQMHLTVDRAAQSRRHVVRHFVNAAFLPKKIVEGAFQIGFTHAKERRNAPDLAIATVITISPRPIPPTRILSKGS